MSLWSFRIHAAVRCRFVRAAMDAVACRRPYSIIRCRCTGPNTSYRGVNEKVKCRENSHSRRALGLQPLHGDQGEPSMEPAEAKQAAGRVCTRARSSPWSLRLWRRSHWHRSPARNICIWEPARGRSGLQGRPPSCLHNKAESVGTAANSEFVSNRSQEQRV